MPTAYVLSTILKEYRSALSGFAEVNSSPVRESRYMCILWPDSREIPTNSATLHTALAFDIFCILSRFKAGMSLLRSSNPLDIEYDQNHALPSRLALYLMRENPNQVVENTKQTKVRKLSNSLRVFMKNNPTTRQCHWPTMRRFTP